MPGAWQALRRRLGAHPLQCKRGCTCPVLLTKGCTGVKQMKRGGNWFSSVLFFNVACILIYQKPARPSPEACWRLAMQNRGSIPSFSCLWQVITVALQPCWSAAVYSLGGSVLVFWEPEKIRTTNPFLQQKWGSHQIYNTEMYQQSFPSVSVGKIPRKYQPIPTKHTKSWNNSTKNGLQKFRVMWKHLKRGIGGGILRAPSKQWIWRKSYLERT